jgi:hypothetical protein
MHTKGGIWKTGWKEEGEECQTDKYKDENGRKVMLWMGVTESNTDDMKTIIFNGYLHQYFVLSWYMSDMIE